MVRRRGMWLVMGVTIVAILMSLGLKGRGGSPAVTRPPSPTVASTVTRPLPTVTPVPTASGTSRERTQRVGMVASARPLARPLPRLRLAEVQSAARGWVRVPYTGDAYGIRPLPGVITYTVQPGDTLSGIAARFGLSLNAVRWSNPAIEYNPDDIYPGQVLRLPPLEGVVVEVQPGDTVEKLARRYNVPPEVIRTYAPNRLRPPYTLTPGTLLIIPGGSKIVHLPPPQSYPGYVYMWPVRGRITQRYSARHRAWDIATIYDAGVYASRAGRVRVARWDDTGYGYMVIIDHGDGWNTLYAHLKGALVTPGQWVEQGALIGRVGGTGRATGPHVHWEIRRGRTRYDPAQFLPPSP